MSLNHFQWEKTENLNLKTVSLPIIQAMLFPHESTRGQCHLCVNRQVNSSHKHPPSSTLGLLGSVFQRCCSTISSPICSHPGLRLYLVPVAVGDLLLYVHGQHLATEGEALRLLDHLLVRRHRVVAHHHMTLRKERHRCRPCRSKQQSLSE